MIFVAPKIFSQNLQQKISLIVKQQPTLNAVSAKVSTKNFLVLAPNYKAIIPLNYYSTNLGFFCKQEIKFEKVTKVPFKLRLGSVEECDRMEGKRKFDK